MQFRDFFRLITEKRPSPRVEFEMLRDLVTLHHFGVGKVTVKYFPDFDGAQLGNFIWLEQERTSPYEEPFNDAMIFVNNKVKEPALRRFIAAKELMHVFDSAVQRTDTRVKFEQLLEEIGSMPIRGDMSEGFTADREALWKAVLCLIPPWIRDEHKSDWGQTLTAPELAGRLVLPMEIVEAAMGSYYDRMFERFLGEGHP